MICFLLLEMTNKLHEGLEDNQPKQRRIVKDVNFGIYCCVLNFDYVAYRKFKQIFFEIYQEENRENSSDVPVEILSGGGILFAFATLSIPL